MALPNVKDARKLSDKELLDEIYASKLELFKIRFRKATGQSFKPHSFMHVKRKLAQLMTVHRERGLHYSAAEIDMDTTYQFPENLADDEQGKSYSYLTAESSSESEGELFKAGEKGGEYNTSKAANQSDSFSSGEKDEMNKIDSYLIFAFESLRKGLEPEGIGYMESDNGLYLLPMMIQVDNKSVDLGDAPDYIEKSRIGRFIIALGSIDTIKYFQYKSSVVSVKASRRSADWEGDDICTKLVPDEVNFHSPLNFIDCNKIHSFEKGDKAIIAFIDSGVDILHNAFLGGNGKTRILGFLDSPNGVEYLKGDIDSFIASSEAPSTLRDTDQDGVYFGHGTHVASIAAGRAEGEFSGGVAPAVKIVAIRFDKEQLLGDFQEYSKALSYIERIAAQHNNLPVVINVSNGVEDGGRDGRAPLEALFEDFLDRGKREGFVIVKSAGNKRDKKHHASLSLSSGMAETLKWQVAKKNSKHCEIQLWFNQSCQLDITLYDPDGNLVSTLGYSSSTYRDMGYCPNGNSFFMRYVVNPSDNEDSYVDIVITNGKQDSIKRNNWALKIKAVNTFKESEIHAWINGQVSSGITFQNHVKEKVTLTIPGTSDHVIAVASMKNLEEPRDDSSEGFTRDSRDKPDVAAPGEKIIGARAGTTGGTIVKSGSSMAAPHVSGGIALVLSAREKIRQRNSDSVGQFSSIQIRARLQLTARGFDGQANSRIGFGFFDLESMFHDLITDNLGS